MSEHKLQKYFRQKSSDWNIIGFLNACKIELVEQKIECYLLCLEKIANNEKGCRATKAQELLKRYREASIFLYFWKNINGNNGVTSGFELPLSFKAPSRSQYWCRDVSDLRGCPCLRLTGTNPVWGVPRTIDLTENSQGHGRKPANIVLHFNSIIRTSRAIPNLEILAQLMVDNYEDSTDNSDSEYPSTEESEEDIVVSRKRKRRNVRTEIENNEEDDDLQPLDMELFIDGNTTPPSSSLPKKVITPQKPNLDASFGDHIVVGERGCIVQMHPAVQSWLMDVLLSNKETFKSALDGSPCSEFAEVCKFILMDLYWERKYTVENIVPMFKGIAAIYDNVTFDWIEAELSCIRGVKAMFPKSAITVHKADGIGISRVNQKETIFIEVSGGPVNPVAKHIVEDTEKLIREGVFGLIAILRDHLTKPLEKCMQVRTFILQVIADRMTLSEVGLSNIKHKYVVLEICSAQIPFAFDDVPKFMHIFNLLHTLV
ncbi:6931_t:CDS:2, partial [Paraglomus occultum]